MSLLVLQQIEDTGQLMDLLQNFVDRVLENAESDPETGGKVLNRLRSCRNDLASAAHNLAHAEILMQGE